eukprot:CAMPEP_0169208696 /NCGR_PEP_ID=MMETSP1016-20121227/14269_1 /TAXON_ID=342587 /ORGANISM="Karlodinium micrum, Strain CCMP2283" /LENGTH=497 /DNA_ID=CAMNT_0009286087 /DNA_START=44 /DNA_END=1534 /DNA_ORIENTATION=+
MSMCACFFAVIGCLLCVTHSRRVQPQIAPLQSVSGAVQKESGSEIDESRSSNSFVQLESHVGFHPRAASLHTPAAPIIAPEVATSKHAAVTDTRPLVTRSSHLAPLPVHRISHHSSVVRMSVSEGNATETRKPSESAEGIGGKEAMPDIEDADQGRRRGLIGFVLLLAAAVIDKFGTAPPGTPAVATPSDASSSKSGGVETEVSLSGMTGINRFRLACWKFVRPHTIRGTILGSSAVTLRVVLENPVAIDWALIPRALLGVLCLLCGNGYIVGINQIYDVDMDTINKPFLPIAAGELSKAAAWALCLVFAATGLGLTALNFGSLITSLYAFGLLLGTVYSVPPLRLKRFPVPAFLIIATVRGFLLNFGVYYAARAAMQLPFVWSPTILFATCFVTWFATVIAVSKDLPDIEGDRAEGVKTFAVRIGADKLSYIAAGMLVTLYGAGAALPIAFPASFRLWLMTPLHVIIAGLVVRAALRLRATNWSQQGIKTFYRFIW